MLVLNRMSCLFNRTNAPLSTVPLIFLIRNAYSAPLVGRRDLSVLLGDAHQRICHQNATRASSIAAPSGPCHIGMLQSLNVEVNLNVSTAQIYARFELLSSDPVVRGFVGLGEFNGIETNRHSRAGAVQLSEAFLGGLLTLSGLAENCVRTCGVV